MHRKKLNRNGFTIAEMVTVVGIASLIGVTGVSMLIGTIRCCDKSTNRNYSDADAVTAMQLIVSQVREAKSFQTLDNGSRLRITPPSTVQNEEYYDNRETDTTKQVDFYLSNATGNQGVAGTYLWQSTNNNAKKQLLIRDVKSVSFTQDTEKSVEITIVTSNLTSSGPVETQLTQRVVYLRN